jgi:hypothetical protein
MTRAPMAATWSIVRGIALGKRTDQLGQPRVDELRFQDVVDNNLQRPGFQQVRSTLADHCHEAHGAGFGGRLQQFGKF